MSLYTLVYTSVATHPMTEAELIDLLEISRKKNKLRNITGVLLHRKGHFMQALEGDKDDVLYTYRKILSDKRHRHAQVIYQRDIDERIFDDWSMGFENLDSMKPDDLPGFSDFLNKPLSSTAITFSPSRVELFLELFRQRGSH